jgi:hypothetical protein
VQKKTQLINTMQWINILRKKQQCSVDPYCIEEIEQYCEVEQFCVEETNGRSTEEIEQYYPL